jgi:hypothetical protein
LPQQTAYFVPMQNACEMYGTTLGGTVDEAVKRLRQHLVPVFRKTDAGRLDLLGSEIWLRDETSDWLVSAWHVFGEKREPHGLYHGIGLKPRRIRGEQRVLKDTDIAAIRLSTESLATTPQDKSPVDAYALSPESAGRASDSFIFYVASGYPGGKAKEKRHSGSFRINPYHHLCEEAEFNSAIVRTEDGLLLRPDQCLFLKYQKFAWNSAGMRQSLPSPKGMSGGPVWKFVLPNSTSSTPSVSLVGILTTYLKQPVGVLAATRSELVAELLWLPSI